jgi:hypothetical protein
MIKGIMANPIIVNKTLSEKTKARPVCGYAYQPGEPRVFNQKAVLFVVNELFPGIYKNIDDVLAMPQEDLLRAVRVLFLGGLKPDYAVYVEYDSQIGRVFITESK